MSEEKNSSSFGNRDYENNAYFSCRAKNFTVVFKPRIEELLSTGEFRVARADDGGKDYKKGELMEGIRIEFNNRGKMYEKTEENKPFIRFLRMKIEAERDLPDNKKSLKELVKPIKQIPETEVNKLLAEKEAQVRAEYGKKEEKIKDSGPTL